MEDDESSLQLAKRIVVSMGHQVLAEKDGGRALMTAQAEKPDLILLDLHLPTLDGIEIARALRAETATRSIPIVVVSAGSALDRAKAISAGCDDFLAKPYQPDQLRAAIRKRLSV